MVDTVSLAVRSDRYRNSCDNQGIVIVHPTSFVQRTLIHGPDDNGVTGIENPGYMQQPPPYTEITGPNSTQSSAPPANVQVIKAPGYTEQYNRNTPGY
ncbi:uncharacterized protein LOC134723773 isoform X2 [Mytilus trossulus]|uniref:uncharacterized protein LOC134723773 isoform X2 n=1 Tax=Mytilus trossulus TaxID=6551 RepID=UPI0030078423